MVVLFFLIYLAIGYVIVWFGALVVQACLAGALSIPVADISYWPVFWMLVVIAIVTWLVQPSKG